ncbi:MAG: TPM domain-containing protein [Candidatus Goldiibacteriota bacterium]
MKKIIFSAVLLFAAVFYIPVSALPVQTDRYVNDKADIIPAEDISVLRAKLRDFEKTDGIRFSVLTIKKTAEYGFDSIDEFARAAAEAGRIGQKNRAGILFVVSADDRELIFNMGRVHGDKYDNEIDEIIKNDILPHFRKLDYGAGILSGASKVISVVETPEKKVSVADIALWTAVLAGGGAAVLGVILFGRKKPAKKKEKPDLSFGGGSSGSWK